MHTWKAISTGWILSLSGLALCAPLNAASTTAHSATVPSVSNGAVEWHSDALERSLDIAGKQDKLVLVYCWAGQSEYCSEFWQKTLSTEALAKPLGQFVCYSADNGTMIGSKLIEKLHVATLPTVFFLNPDGTPEDVIGGYAETGTFVHELHRIASGEKTLSDLRQIVEQLGADQPKGNKALEARWQLAVKFSDMGLMEEHDQQLAHVRELDAKGKTPVGARLKVSDMLEAIGKEAGGKEQLANWNLNSVYDFAKRHKNSEVRFETWGQIAELEYARHQFTESCKAMKLAWDHCPKDSMVNFGHKLAYTVVELQEHCSSKEKKMAMKVAEQTLMAAEKLAADKEALYKLSPDMTSEGLLASTHAMIAKVYLMNGKDKLAEQSSALAHELKAKAKLKDDQAG